MVFSFSSICCYWGKWATNILPGVGGLPGNDGGPPAGNHGQHDGGGDLQGQADILHEVSIIQFSSADVIFSTGCLMWPVKTCTQWGSWLSPTPSRMFLMK